MSTREGKSVVSGFVAQYSHFLLGNAASLILGFATFPLLTRLLTREQYGVLGLVTTILLFGGTIARAGLSDGIIRLYEEHRRSESLRSIFSSTVFFQGCFFAAGATALYFALLPVFFMLFSVDPVNYTGFLIMGGCLAARAIGNVATNLMRVEGKTISLNIVNFGSKVLSIVLSILLLLSFSRSLTGYFLGLTLTEILVTAVLLSWFFRNFTVNLHGVSGDLTKRLISFGAPLLLTELSYTVMSYGDRFVVAGLSGAESLGTYTVGYNLAMYIANIVVFPLSYAIVPAYVSIYERDGREKTQVFLNKCLRYFTILVIPMCAGFYGLADDLFVTLASQKYRSAATFSPLILIANLVLGLNCVFNAGLFLNKRSAHIMLIMVASGVFNIGSNLALVPRFGLMGAAVSTLLSCLLASGMSIVFSRRYFRFSVPVRDVVFYLLLSGAMVAVLRMIPVGQSASALLLKAAVGVVIVGAGFIAREKELQVLLHQHSWRKTVGKSS